MTQTTYPVEYADNSHIWMTPAKEYAQKLHAMGFTFEDYEAEHKHTANSMWGDDLKAELQRLAMADALEQAVELDNEIYAVEEEEEETMNDYKLDQLANQIAEEAFEMVKDGTPDYEAEDFICESVDGSEWVIYYYKAHQVCQNCKTDQGADWMEQCGIKGDSYDDYATKLAYGELYCRASNALTLKLGELV
jgi:hypothetical protein